MQQVEKKPLSYSTLIVPFHILTSTLLSLLIPLSYLLLSRLTITHNPNSYSLPFSLFLYTNPSLLHALVAIVSVATLFNTLTGHTTTGPPPETTLRSPLYPAWILLCAFQLCVGMGVEVDMGPGLENLGLGYERSLLSKVVFFLGLHETMLHWWRMVVKPVVDDTLFGWVREEKWAERVVMAMGLGGLWWWRLRNEVVALVVVGEVKREFSIEVELVDFVGWWLYYLTVTIGLVRVVKGIIWVGIILTFKRRRVQVNDVVVVVVGDFSGDEEKV